MQHKIIKKIFDKYALGYARKYADQDLYRADLEILPLLISQDKPQILDIGCGPGNLTHAISELFPEADITGIDLSSEMLKIAKSRIPKAKFRQMNSNSISRIASVYDLVVAGFLLPYLNQNELKKLIHDLSIILEPGGIFFMSTMIHKRGFLEEDVRRADNHDETLPTFYHTEEAITDFTVRNGFHLVHANNIDNPGYIDNNISDLILVFQKYT
ncbi:MAG: class I SAM-dependent methyltransferase [Saprospiraceae bacterium]|nr:class I SAM-dependent methyltransferase [Saprospiraceae bacterium]